MDRVGAAMGCFAVIFTGVIAVIAIIGKLNYQPRRDLSEPSVSIEKWNERPLSLLNQNKIEHQEDCELNVCKVLVSSTRVGEAQEIIVRDAKERGYWVMVESGVDNGVAYNKPDLSKISWQDALEAQKRRIR